MDKKETIKIGMVSLGCAKNLVDSEIVLGMLDNPRFEFVTLPEKADVIIVNTCGFIESSKQESINSILEMAGYNKKLVVIGCLVERYLEDLKKAIPEVDLFVPIKEYSTIDKQIENLIDENNVIEPFNPLKRVVSTQPYTAYLRISEGCNNRCTYCAIPIIRGGFKSRPFDEIIKEAHILKDRGVKELVVISQDTTRYGSDFKEKRTIVDLLNELLKIKEFDYIRLLYLYPDEISDELLYLIGKEPRLTPYFDVPIQHSSSKLLKSMNRRGNREFLLQLFRKIRSIVPNAVLRTTLILGFPGETDEDFQDVLSFIEEVKFDHLGCFTYSREEDTVSYGFENQIEEDIKQKRYDILMKKQKLISYNLNKTHLGEVMEGLVVGHDEINNVYFLRSGWNAPDDIDGKISFKSANKLELGQKVKVKITNAFVYDLDGELIK
ncbi:MAG: 30S ribosomal protein S12 methylthiotransferase RimO [Bacilli bacterium]|nr:30S ribosomal protein S12 methylthiotransferase RimO [Bacilli bacterium]